MPGVAAIGASVAGAIGTAATAAVGALSAVGIANGLMIAGTGLSLIGKVTGSKTLSNIGLGFSAAGGVTGLVNGFNGNASNKQTISGGNSKTTKLLQSDNIDNALAETTKGAKTINDLKTFEPAGAMTNSVDHFKTASSKIGANTGNVQSIDPGFLQRAGNTLMKYDTTANVLMGMGNAYLTTRNVQAQEDMFDKRLDFEREEINRRQGNYGTPSAASALPGIRRVNNPSPLLRSNF